MAKDGNRNRVPVKQWRKWSAGARRVFNETYRFVIGNPDLMQHPAAPKPKPYHWKTVAWNAAWVAADAVDSAVPTRGQTFVDIDRRGREVRRQRAA